jgi:3-hydroxyacyl-[acyl-carrier-protein] dehydratase
MLLDGMYTLIEKKDDTVRVMLAESTHPIFQAHFPSKPILPGFVHLEIISTLFNVEISKIKKAKFLDLVLPSQALTYSRDDNKYFVRHNGNLVASIIL